MAVRPESSSRDPFARLRPRQRVWKGLQQLGVAVGLTYLLCGASLAFVVGFPLALALYLGAFGYVTSTVLWLRLPRSPWIVPLSVPIFVVVSSMFWILIAPVAALLVPVILVAELSRVLRRWSTIRYLSFYWLAVMTPTFGLMALLLARRWHFYLPQGSTLGIWLGFSYTAIYDFFIPSPELYEWDHPFPPLTNAELDIIGLTTLAVAAVSVYVLFRTGGRDARRS